MINYREEDSEDSLTFGEFSVDEAIKCMTTGEEIERYAVYWLECHLPEFETRSMESYRETAKALSSLLDVEQDPSWLAASLRSDSAHYVGYTSSLDPRIEAHIRGEGSEFCRLFPPKELRGLWWFSSKKEARLAEQSKATQIRDEIENGYLFQY